MPEFLVISTDDNVIAAVDRLRSSEGVVIEMERDFTRGLKSIFYRLPAATFIQEEIDGIRGEKVAAQVRKLLEDETLSLVLLHHGEVFALEQGSPFDAVVDCAQPWDILAQAMGKEMGLRGGSAGQDVEAVGIESTRSPGVVGGDGIDPFSDFFPADIHHSWESLHPEEDSDERGAYGNIETTASEHVDPFAEFTFDPPGDIVSSIPSNAESELSRTPPPPQKSDGDDNDPGTGGMGDRLAGRESPHRIFASMSEENGHDTTPQPAPEGEKIRSNDSRLRLKGVETRSNMSQNLAVGDKTSVTSSASKAVRMTTIQAGDNAAHVIRSPKVDKFSANSSSRRIIFFLLLLLTGASSFLAIRYWDELWSYFLVERREVGTLPDVHIQQQGQELPHFIPLESLDASYSDSHPGWDRYLSGDLQFLVFREGKRVRAIQVLAGSSAPISESFLKKCIRESAGQESPQNWLAAEKDGFLVENVRMDGKGEVSVYRKLPEREIRGFVISFD